MNYLAVNIQPVHLEAISMIELCKILRRESASRGKGHALSYSQSLAVAYALKEAHRLGVIRGRAVK